MSVALRKPMPLLGPSAEQGRNLNPHTRQQFGLQSGASADPRGPDGAN
jgi:hypothetical protein